MNSEAVLGMKGQEQSDLARKNLEEINRVRHTNQRGEYLTKE